MPCCIVAVGTSQSQFQTEPWRKPQFATAKTICQIVSTRLCWVHRSGGLSDRHLLSLLSSQNMLLLCNGSAMTEAGSGQCWAATFFQICQSVIRSVNHANCSFQTIKSPVRLKDGPGRNWQVVGRPPAAWGGFLFSVT